MERNTRLFPSGIQRAPESFASCAVSFRAREPSTPAIQMSVRPRFASTSVTRTVKATDFPSGEIRGSEIRSIASMSWTENGCGDWAEPTDAEPRDATNHDCQRTHDILLP